MRSYLEALDYVMEEGGVKHTYGTEQIDPYIEHFGKEEA